MPDTTTLMITLPADEALAAQVEQRLARHAEVMRPPPQTLSLEAIFLIVSIVAAGAATASSIAAIRASQAATDASRASVTATQTETVKTLLEIRQMLHEQGRAAEVQVGPATGPMRSLAEHCYRESLTLHERQGDAVKAATTCNQLTIVAKGAGRPAEATGWYQRALEYFERLKDTGAQAKVLNNLADLLLAEVRAGRMGRARLAEARGSAERALEIRETLDASSEI